jgi:hypothetical protein
VTKLDALGGWPTFTFFVKVGTARSDVTAFLRGDVKPVRLAGGPFKPHFGLSGAFPKRKPNSSQGNPPLLIAQRFHGIQSHDTPQSVRRGVKGKVE